MNVAPPDDVTQEWWDATREHRYTLQACGCGHVQHPPRALCVSCGSLDKLSLRAASGAGVVDTFTVVHRAPRPDIETPYTIARIRLAEGPIVLTRLAGPDWTIGDAVVVTWLDLPDGRALPLFARAP